jgi:hypothetical protein
VDVYLVPDIVSMDFTPTETYDRILTLLETFCQKHPSFLKGYLNVLQFSPQYALNYLPYDVGPIAGRLANGNLDLTFLKEVSKLLGTSGFKQLSKLVTANSSVSTTNWNTTLDKQVGDIVKPLISQIRKVKFEGLNPRWFIIPIVEDAIPATFQDNTAFRFNVWRRFLMEYFGSTLPSTMTTVDQMRYALLINNLHFANNPTEGNRDFNMENLRAVNAITATGWDPTAWSFNDYLLCQTKRLTLLSRPTDELSLSMLLTPMLANNSLFQAAYVHFYGLKQLLNDPFTGNSNSVMSVYLFAQYLESNVQLCPAVTQARPVSPYVVPSSTNGTINTSFTFSSHSSYVKHNHNFLPAHAQPQKQQRNQVDTRNQSKDQQQQKATMKNVKAQNNSVRGKNDNYNSSTNSPSNGSLVLPTQTPVNPLLPAYD